MFKVTDWKKYKVLITGYTGFIGGVLANNLVLQQASVTCLVKNPEKQRGTPLPDKLAIVPGNITNPDSLISIFKKLQPDIVFHLAAESIQDQGKNYTQNVVGTKNILEAMRSASPRTCLVFASSDAVYGIGQNEPFTESVIPKPATPYAESKFAAEKIIIEYSDKFNLSSIIARISNVYGGHDQNFSHLIPGQILNVLSGRPPSLNSNGKSVCDFIYIDDVVDGFITLGANLLARQIQGGIFNLSTGKSTRVIDAVAMILDITNSNTLVPVLNLSNKTYDSLKQTSPEKMQNLLGWKTKTALKEGLKKTVLWYKENSFNKMEIT